MDSFHLLIVEDDSSELNRLVRVFSRLEPNARLLRAADPVSACNQFRKHRPEVVVLDLGLSGHGPNAGLEVVSRLSGIDPTARIIVLTGYTGEEIGIRAVENGAASFLAKPANMTALHALVRDYSQTARFRRSRIATENIEAISGMVGVSAQMRNVYRLIRQCAMTDSSVLIIGETGTGKELVAQAIHQLSRRKDTPVSIFFGSSPSGLAEAELFGYERGAYTGAKTEGSKGAIARADKGTLFIDELCSLDLDVQRKLLRVLEEKSYRPLGSSVVRRSDFRLVSAAQPRIYDLVRESKFREDLLARVEVVTIVVPPLRERREDIVPLAEYFLAQVKMGLIDNGNPCRILGFTKEALKLFREYPWPRNVRELKHVVHNGIIQAQLRGSEKVSCEDVHHRLHDLQSNDSQHEKRVLNEFLLRPGITIDQATKQLERLLIASSLSRHRNVFSAVCQELGLGRTTLWRKLRDYRLGSESPTEKNVAAG